MVRDKLPAFSGIAREFYDQLVAASPLSHPRYLAGMWTPLLAVQLVWKADSGTSSDRPHDYRAPSWSWASVDKPISSPLDHISRRISNHTIINILHAEVSAVGDDPFQEVSGGFIRVEGWLWKISKGASLRQVGESAKLNLQLAFDDGVVKSTKRPLDDDVFLLPIIVDPDDSMAMYVWGILLNKYGEKPGHFKRVGFLSLSDGGSKRLKMLERRFHPIFEPVLELYGRCFPCIEIAREEEDCTSSRRDERFPSDDTFRLGSHLCTIDIF